LIALSVAQAAVEEPSDRKVLGMIGYRAGAHLLDQSPYIVMVQLQLAELLVSGSTRLADGR
jgi:hypothetical protein